MNDYTRTERTRVRRKHDRGHYDRETVHGILDEGLICTLSFTVDGRPFGFPTAYWRDGERIYVHGSAASFALRSLSKSIEACLTVSHLDGIVLARSAFHHSLNYRSVMIFGTAVLIEDIEEKTTALIGLMERVAPGRWDEIRQPNDQEMKGTTVLRLELDELSAKIRSGPPIDDEEDYALSCWAGVVPIGTVIGKPIADPLMPDGIPTPDYATNFSLGGK